jgi:hypothetical protein
MSSGFQGLRPPGNWEWCTSAIAKAIQNTEGAGISVNFQLRPLLFNKTRLDQKWSGLVNVYMLGCGCSGKKFRLLLYLHLFPNDGKSFDMEIIYRIGMHHFYR